MLLITSFCCSNRSSRSISRCCFSLSCSMSRCCRLYSRTHLGTGRNLTVYVHVIWFESTQPNKGILHAKRSHTKSLNIWWLPCIQYYRIYSRIGINFMRKPQNPKYVKIIHEFRIFNGMQWQPRAGSMCSIHVDLCVYKYYPRWFILDVKHYINIHSDLGTIYMIYSAKFRP